MGLDSDFNQLDLVQALWADAPEVGRELQGFRERLVDMPCRHYEPALVRSIAHNDPIDAIVDIFTAVPNNSD